jgi:hypothetical protein
VNLLARVSALENPQGPDPPRARCKNTQPVTSTLQKLTRRAAGALQNTHHLAAINLENPHVTLQCVVQNIHSPVAGEIFLTFNTAKQPLARCKNTQPVTSTLQKPTRRAAGALHKHITSPPVRSKTHTSHRSAFWKTYTHPPQTNCF